VQKLVAKTYLFLARKIIYEDLAEMAKHFYKKIYIITLCNFFGIGASHDKTHDISKN
jgi:hypothetical protein